VIGLALFMQDHGFDPPYYLLVFNTPTERLLHSKRFFDIQQTWTIVEEHKTLWRSAWPHETCASNSILYIQRFWHLSFWQNFDPRISFIFQVCEKRFLKQCIQALTPSPFLSCILFIADHSYCPLAFSIIPTDQEPGKGQ